MDDQTMNHKLLFTPSSDAMVLTLKTCSKWMFINLKNKDSFKVYKLKLPPLASWYQDWSMFIYLFSTSMVRSRSRDWVLSIPNLKGSPKIVGPSSLSSKVYSRSWDWVLYIFLISKVYLGSQDRVLYFLSNFKGLPNFKGSIKFVRFRH